MRSFEKYFYYFHAVYYNIIFVISFRTILLITLRGYGSVFPWDEQIRVEYRKKWREGVRGGTIAEIDDEDFVEDAVT